MSRCKCPKSDEKPSVEYPPYFEDITVKMEERRCDLIGRHKHLRDKITTMERSIPALLAYNMWVSKKCEDAPYCKIREIMKRFAPQPDQTERLLKSLKNTVKELNVETEELHEKIIQVDIKLEETEMELESLELANKEMNDILNKLEKEVRSYSTPSLHSIHSEDLLCLSKIRRLAEEELNLKNCIKELEQKETIFKDHIDRLLTCKEYQNACDKRKITTCIQDLDYNGKKTCAMPKKCLWYKQSGLHLKKNQERDQELKLEQKQEEKKEQKLIEHNDVEVSTSKQSIEKRDQETKSEMPEENVGKRTSWIPNWWTNNQKTEEIPPQSSSAVPSTSSNIENNEIEKSTITEHKLKEQKTGSDKPFNLLKSKSKSAQCHRPCIAPRDPQCVLRKSCADKLFPPCKRLAKSCAIPPRKPFYELPSYNMADHGIRLGCQQFPSPCEICPSLPCKSHGGPATNCRCNCKGKCARGFSDAPCNCSDELLDPSEEYHPISSKQLADSQREEDSEEEFCECCSCGCEDSNESPYECD